MISSGIQQQAVLIMQLLTIVIILALLATIGALLLCLASMSSGGRFDRTFGTSFMWLRVGFQAAAVILLIFALLLHS